MPHGSYQPGGTQAGPSGIPAVPAVPSISIPQGGVLPGHISTQYPGGSHIPSTVYPQIPSQTGYPTLPSQSEFYVIYTLNIT